jgi:hypothetical protein
MGQAGTLAILFDMYAVRDRVGMAGSYVIFAHLVSPLSVAISGQLSVADS